MAKRKSSGKSGVPAKRGTTALAKNLATEMVGDANKGMENIGADDVAIPFLCILQSNSPQVKKGSGKIKGAEEGDIFNNVTNEVFSGEDGILVVPSFYQKSYVEWVPREQGGGFVRSYNDPDILKQCKRNDENRDVLKSSGNHIVTTAYHFVLLLKKDGSVERCVIGMSSTQLKKSRRWNSQMMSLQIDAGGGRKVNPPMFSHLYCLTTVSESNERGSWSGWQINVEKLIDDADLYQQAKVFHKAIAGGAVRMAPPPTPDAGDADDGVL
jgi:hypothetical protein